jgi:hypothetical protein
MDLPLEAFGPTSENPISDVGVSASAIGSQNPLANRGTIDWAEIARNTCCSLTTSR